MAVPGHVWLSTALALGLAVLHAAAKYFGFVELVPRSSWLSFGGGVSVAYVFVHLLPELAAGQAAIEETEHAVVGALGHHAYLLALAGFVLFYGLERFAELSTTEENVADGDGEQDGVGGSLVFWAHVTPYGVLNATIGYLLLADTATVDDAVLFGVAMGFHFLVNDVGLRRHYAEVYDRVGRWVLAATVLAGWGLATVVHLPEVALLSATAFVGGGVILNVIKEELPAERESRFSYFVVGAAAYAALLVWS